MGLIHKILKRTITKKLPSPVAVVNPAMIVSRSDKECHRVIMRIEAKFTAKKPLTGKDKYDFKQAARALEKRGSLQWVKAVEVPDTMWLDITGLTETLVVISYSDYLWRLGSRNVKPTEEENKAAFNHFWNGTPKVPLTLIPRKPDTV